jgi:hypothetical protein
MISRRSASRRRNDRLADAVHRQAQSAQRASPGARVFYDEQRERGLDHDAALRALSNRLAGILHGCLKSGTLYDEATAWSHRVTIPEPPDNQSPGVSLGHSGQKIRARQEPARTGRGPSPAQYGRSRGSFMIRNMRGMISAGREMSDRIQAGRMHKFARLDGRTPEL